MRSFPSCSQISQPNAVAKSATSRSPLRTDSKAVCVSLAKVFRVDSNVLTEDGKRRCREIPTCGLKQPGAQRFFRFGDDYSFPDAILLRVPIACARWYCPRNEAAARYPRRPKRPTGFDPSRALKTTVVFIPIPPPVHRCLPANRPIEAWSPDRRDPTNHIVASNSRNARRLRCSAHAADSPGVSRLQTEIPLNVTQTGCSSSTTGACGRQRP